VLLNAGANKDAEIYDGTTALIFAAASGNCKSIELLLGAGCDVNARGKRGATVLTYAVQKNHITCVRTLVRAGADVSIKAEGASPFDVADCHSPTTVSH
jgi:ankyrin repeat protein